METNQKIETQDAVGNSSLPVMSIILWYGDLVGIPTNWAVCDGTRGTPDLRNKFIVSVGSNYPVGTTGGNSQVTLAVENLPAHTHESWQYVALTNNWKDGGHNQSSWTGEGSNSNGSSVGGNKPFNIVPPYFSMYYIMRVS